MTKGDRFSSGGAFNDRSYIFSQFYLNFKQQSVVGYLGVAYNPRAVGLLPLLSLLDAIDLCDDPAIFAMTRRADVTDFLVR
jgi:hypothetical protein